MNGFGAGNSPFGEDDGSSGAFDFGGPGWDSMTLMQYDDDSAINMPMDTSGAVYNNKSASTQHLSADSPQGYNPSSGVSSPGLSDHNLDTLSSTSQEDRNDFDNLINYDGDTNEGDCLVPVKPDIDTTVPIKPAIDDATMNILGSMDWSTPSFDESVVYTGIGEQPDNIWGSPGTDLTSDITESGISMSLNSPNTRPMSAASMQSAPNDRYSASPEAVLFHAGLYGGYLTPASIDQKLAHPKQEPITDGSSGPEVDGDDESPQRQKRGKRKTPVQDWENGLSQDQLAEKRLQAASLENQYQVMQTIPLDTLGKRKVCSLAKTLIDQPLVPLPLPFDEKNPMPPEFLHKKQTSIRLLFINCDFPIKSRVETQTTLRIVAQDLPEGVKRLHMPRQTISRPKQLLKEPHAPSPEILEMDCYVVCETAWRKCPERLVRDAYRKACKEPDTPNPHLKLRRSDDEDEEKPSPRERGPSVVEMSLSDPRNPLNGGEVWVCAGCMDREGKRSTRKKVKRPKEEQPWWELESRRLVLMNTMEVRDWILSPPDQYIPTGNVETPGALQWYIDSPVRVACYCRHQHEKVGYRIIYTIKDWQGNFVAQGITAILTVTDDHKAEREKAKMEAAAAAAVSRATLKLQPTTPQPEVKRRKRVGEAPTTPESLSFSHSMPPTPRPSTSSNQGTTYPFAPQLNQLNFAPAYPVLNQLNQMMQNPHPSHQPNRMPANVSSQPAITPLTPFSQQTPISQAPSQNNNAFISNSFQFNPTVFSATVNMRVPRDMHQLSGNSLQDNTSGTTPLMQPNQLQHMVQAPQPAHQAQIQQQPQSSGGFSAPNPPPPMPSHPSFHRPQQPPPSVVQNVIPSEGPVTGGVPVCVLGVNFSPDTEIFFGTVLAPVQKFMSDTCVVVTLPANKPGSVPVYTTMPNNPPETKIFRYIDHNEKMLMELALNVLGSKVAGGKFSASDLARMIIGNNIDLRASTQIGEPTNRQHLERNLLRVLDLIDQDDSPYPARLDLPDKQTGQRMLHLACAMGMQLFVSALLARGVDPNSRDKNGNTPLHLASLYNYPDVVKKLLSSHAEPTLNNKSGLNALNLASSEAVKMEFRRHSLEGRSRHHSRSNSVSSIRYSTSRQSSLGPASEFNESGSDDEPIHDSGSDIFPIYGTARSSRRSSTVNLQEEIGPARPTVTRQPTFLEQLAQPNWQMFSNGFQNMRNIRGNLPAFTPIIGMPNAPTYQQLLEYFNRNVVENMPVAPGLPNYQSLWQRFNIRNLHPAPQNEEPSDGDDAPPSYEEAVKPDEMLSGDTKTALDMMSLTREMEATSVSNTSAASTISVVGESGSSSPPSSAVEIMSKDAHDELVLRRDGRQVIVVGKPKKMDQMRRKIEGASASDSSEAESKTDKMLFFFWIPILILVLTAMMWNVFYETRYQDELRMVGTVIKNASLKVAEFVKERVREERRGRERGRAEVWL